MIKTAKLETLPPNQVSHIVKYYEYVSKTTNEKLIHDWAIAPWILYQGKATAYANTMLMPSSFNLI